MGAICGLVDFQQSPPPEDLHRMSAAMEARARDGVTSLQRQNVAFAFLRDRNVPEDAYEDQPCLLAGGKLFATWARLHNRPELTAKLGLPVGDSGRSADGTLLRLAYERWGEDCLQHLVGQFSLAVWDPTKQALFLACDHMGETSLYVTRRGSRFSFASDPAALFALSDCPRQLDEAEFADFLAGHFAAHHRTLFCGVDRLPSGTAMRVTARDTKRIDYWDLEALPRLRWSDPGELFEAFAEVMEAATQARLRTTGEVGLLLSGGLDSGLVAAFTAPLLRASGRALHSYTLRPLPGSTTRLTAGRVSDERPFVEALAECHPNLITHFSGDTQPHFLTDIDASFEALHMPPLVPTQSAWIGTAMRQLCEQGVRIVLQAQRGNHTASWWGMRPWCEMLIHGHWQQLAQAMGVHHRRDGIPYPDLFRRLFREIFGALANPLRDVLARFRHPVALPLLNQHWLREVGLNDRLNAGYRRGLRSTAFNGRKFRIRLLSNAGYRRHQDIFQRMLVPLGAEGSDVTADRRLVEFSLGLEDADFHHQGWDRALARFAAGERLPELIRWRTTRGLQPIDALRNSWRNAELVEATLDSFRADTDVRERLDVNAMGKLWQQLLEQRGEADQWSPPDIRQSLKQVNHFHSVLAAGKFLQWLRSPKNAAATPVDLARVGSQT